MLEDALESFRFAIEVDTKDGEARARALAKEILEIAKVTNTTAKEAGQMAGVWIKSFAELDASTKLVLKSAQEYAVALEKIDKSIKGGTQRAAVNQVRESEKWFELRAAKELENSNKLKLMDEQAAVLTQEKKLGLENAEAQALRNQLLELEKIALLDKQALQTAQQKNRTEAVDVGGDKARLAIQRLREAESGLFNVSAPLTEKQKQLGKALADLETPSKKAGHGLFSLGNFMRTAFGTLTAIGIFSVLQAIQQFFTGTLKAAQDFRGEMVELNLAEAILSKKGMDVSRKEFEDFISFIENKYQYLSKLDATKVVADTAGAVQEFDVSKTQLKELADAIAFIQLKNKLLGREEADAAHIINAAMDARSNFFNGMGINITEAIIKEKAYALGLVKTGEEIDKATRFQAILALLTEQTSNKQEELNKQIADTPLGDQLKLQKEYADAQLRIGQAFITVRDNLIDFLASFSPDMADSMVKFFTDLSAKANEAIDDIQVLTDSVTTLNDAMTVITDSGETEGGFLGWLAKVGKYIQEFFIFPIRAAVALVQGITTAIVAPVAGVLTFLVELASGVPLQQAYFDGGKAVGEAWARGFGIAIETIGKSGLFKNFPTQDTTNKGGDGLRGRDDTPTGEKKPAQVIEEDTQDLQKALEKMNDEILEAQLKLQQDMEEAQIDLGRKLVDIATEYAKKRADAEREYANKVADINADYNSRVRDIQSSRAAENQRARNDELEREAQFQEEMRQLKENFLMSLDDALHERDARQVLRLIKQYELDKAQAEREHALEQEKAANEQAERNAKFQREMADAERERKEKLAAAQRDYQDKLAKLAADEAAERAAAELAYQRKKEDLEREMQDRLEIVAANLINEFNLTKEGLDAIVALYHQYYAEVSAIYAAMQHMLSGQLMGSKPNSGLSGRGGSKGNNNVRNGMAQGGSIVADQPTSVTFGEAGPEIATFTPIGRTGTDVNKVFSSLGGSDGGTGGQIEIGVSLSPDLESRIIKNTLGETARVISNVRRSKN